MRQMSAILVVYKLQTDTELSSIQWLVTTEFLRKISCDRDTQNLFWEIKCFK